MNRGQIIVVILFVMAIIILAPPIISDRIYNKAKEIAEENQCILEVDLPSIGGFPTGEYEEYKCEQNYQLEQQLNTYLEQSNSWGTITVILIAGFFLLILYGLPILIISILIFLLYKLVKRFLK